MPSSSAIFATENAMRYKQALAKHFGHKIKVTETERHAVFHFSIGTGQVGLVENGLSLSASADGPEDLASIQETLESHLERFAFRETFTAIDWVPNAAPETT